MSDIVLKDKSGVKNTYSDINAINIPDGKGGFVKYSLGSTLPEYDGTVIIEKAESVLGLRRFKETVTPISEYIGTGTDIEGLASFCEQLSFDIEPIEGVYIEDATFTKMTCVFTAIVDGETLLVYGLYMGDDFWVADDLSNPVEPITQFNILSTSNATVDEWLLANTEGVSV